MNSRQRRKANRAYKVLQDFVMIRLRISGEVTEDEIKAFLEQENFLVKKLSPLGSYWNRVSEAGMKIGLRSYARARYANQ